MIDIPTHPACTLDSMRTIVDGDHRMEIIARDPDNEICEEGFIGTARVEEADSLTPVLVDVYVRPEARRNGVATEITLRAMIWAAMEGKTLYLFVAPANLPAQNLYEDLGWTYTGDKTGHGSWWMEMPEVDPSS